MPSLNDHAVSLCGRVLLAQIDDAGGSTVSITVLPDIVSRGGTASIYKGRADISVAGHREVALKVIQRATDTNTREQIEREFRALRRVRHPCIVPFLGSAELDDASVIITPFMKNGNLLAFLRNYPCFTRRSLVQVADAINYLHTEAGFVHGDLKCENVLVSDDGNALLADFGLSAPVDKADAEETTRTDFRAWRTLPFAAPELLLDQATSDSGRKRSKTPESDVYAYGMLVLQAFTGKRPWAESPPALIMLNIATRIPHPRPESHDQYGFSDFWWEVCTACWEFNPAHRPSMEEVHGVLVL